MNCLYSSCYKLKGDLTYTNQIGIAYSILCHNDKENWSYLWQYPVLIPFLLALRNFTKTATEELISIELEEFPLQYKYAWDKLDC
jgi:hypothetical protein